MSRLMAIKNSLLLPVIMFSVVSRVSAQDYNVIFEPAVELPEISVGTVSGQYQNTASSKRLIANRLSLTSGGDTRIGILRYRSEKGRLQYGIGYKKLIGASPFNAIMTGKGVMLATERKDVLYNFHVRNEEPQTGLKTTYIQFSLMSQW